MINSKNECFEEQFNIRRYDYYLPKMYSHMNELQYSVREIWYQINFAKLFMKQSKADFLYFSNNSDWPRIHGLFRISIRVKTCDGYPMKLLLSYNCVSGQPKSARILFFLNLLFLLPAEGWEVYKRGSHCVCHSVPKNYEGSQRLCQIFLDIVSGPDIFRFVWTQSLDEIFDLDFWTLKFFRL